jgi:hypothetical protein
MDAVRIGSKHCRAICDEVGDRLRQYIDKSPTAPSQKILTLLRELELRELEAPSIVPSIEDMDLLSTRQFSSCPSPLSPFEAPLDPLAQSPGAG